MDEKILFKDECYRIQGAVFEVHGEMGAGFLEAVYQECLEREFMRKGIPFLREKPLALTYKGELLQQVYKPDFICYGAIIVELKAVKDLLPEHRAQVLNYLKATQFRIGLLVNFGSHPKAVIERIVH